MTKQALKKLIREAITETLSEVSETLPPNTPGRPFHVEGDSVVVSNFSKQSLNVSVKKVSGVFFVDIRET